MRLKELVEFQLKYSHLEKTKMTKKSLCDLVIPFRDKYGLSDGQALRVARREFSLKQIEELMIKPKPTNGDIIRARNDHELAESIMYFICDINEGVEYSDNPNDWLEWLKKPAEVDNG